MNRQGQTICLCMIVKNEAPVIRRCLDSVRGLIDYWVIVDTGSTDGTQEIIRQHLADVPGVVHEQPWQDFARNRSEALALARPCADYSLIIDADDALELAPDFALPELTADAYMIDIEDVSVRYQRMQLVSNALPWRYEGVLHEFLTCEGSRPPAHLPGVIMHRNHDGARRRDPSTYVRDAAVLERALETETDPFLRSRYTFYLAQSYKDCGQREKAFEYYLKRAELGFWDQEVYIALYRAGQMLIEIGGATEEALNLFERASETCPWRAEALHAACRLCRIEGRNAEGYEIGRRGLDLSAPDGGLFVEPWIYDYGLRDEFSVHAYWAGHYQESLDACLAALAAPTLPTDQRERVAGNAKFANARLTEIRVRTTVRTAGTSSEFEPSLPAPAVMKSRSGLVSVITPTGNRAEFLRKALNCFRTQDYPQLEWLVLDDSPEPEPTFAAINLPNLQYVHTSEKLSIGEKRNRLIESARGEFIVQFDDDDYYSPQYVDSMVGALQARGADLVNLRGWYLYDERSKFFGYWDLERKIGPHFRCDANGVSLVVLDETNNAGFAQNEFGFGFSYAFRRSVWEASRFPDVDFDEDGLFVRNAQAAFKVDGVYDRTGIALHYLHAGSSSRCFPQYEIPRFAAERLFPALDLETLRARDGEDPSATASTNGTARPTSVLADRPRPAPATFVINLDRSPDRLASFETRNRHLPDVTRFPAVDGSLLERGELVRAGVIHPDCSYSAGTLGCALSHVALWRRAVAENMPLTILEDDITAAAEFDALSREILSEVPADWDFVLWGYPTDRLKVWVDCGASRASLEFLGRTAGAAPLAAGQQRPGFVRLLNAFGALGYSVSPKGARTLLEKCLPLHKRAIQFAHPGVSFWDQGIDCAMNGAYPTMKAFVSIPPLVVQDEVGYAASVRQLIDG